MLPNSLVILIHFNFEKGNLKEIFDKFAKCTENFHKIVLQASPRNTLEVQVKKKKTIYGALSPSPSEVEGGTVEDYRG